MHNEEGKASRDSHVIPENIYFFEDRFNGVSFNQRQQLALACLCILTIIVGLFVIFKFVV
jgi:hypothetical protein